MYDWFRDEHVKTMGASKEVSAKAGPSSLAGTPASSPA